MKKKEKLTDFKGGETVSQGMPGSCMTAENSQMTENRQMARNCQAAENSQTAEPVYGNRNYKDTVFRMLFRDKQNLLDLYNAMNGSDYKDSELLEIVTLENAVYMNMKNDLAFLADFHLYLYEHQSTVNPNIPLRFLQYVAKEYEKLTDKNRIYGEKRIVLPEPQFAVFYNGKKPLPEKMELKLSESFSGRDGSPGQTVPQLELRVQVWNINAGNNEHLKEQCQVLKEYMQYEECVREKAKAVPVKEAVPLAVDECIKAGILSDFLQKNKAEVVPMSIYEYDEAAVMEVIREEGREEGLEAGREEGLEAGREEGIGLMKRLMRCLQESGRQEEIWKITADDAYMRRLLSEYSIK